MARLVAGAAAAGLALLMLAATASANSSGFSRYGLHGPLRGADFFGGSLALSFDEKYAAVSEINNPVVATPGGNQIVGTVFVYQRAEGKATTGNWTRLTSVTPDPALLPPYNPQTAFHEFGAAVALSKDPSSPMGKARHQLNGLLLATAATWDRQFSGVGFLYRLNKTGNGYDRIMGPFTPTPTGQFDGFGASAAMIKSGKRFVIGAKGENAAYVYDYRTMTKTWAMTQRIVPQNTTQVGLFGRQVVLSDNGKVLVVGSQVDGPGPSYTWVFTHKNGRFVQTAQLAPSSTTFGWRSLAISGDGKTIAVGVHLVPGVFVYRYTKGSWKLVADALFAAGQTASVSSSASSSNAVAGDDRSRALFPIPGERGWGFSVGLDKTGALLLVCDSGFAATGTGVTGACYFYTRSKRTGKYTLAQGPIFDANPALFPREMGQVAALGRTGKVAIAGAPDEASLYTMVPLKGWAAKAAKAL